MAGAGVAVTCPPAETIRAGRALGRGRVRVMRALRCSPCPERADHSVARRGGDHPQSLRLFRAGSGATGER
jgi:hypothetical protein